MSHPEDHDDDRFEAALVNELAQDVRRPAPRGLRDQLLHAPLRGRLYRFADTVAQLMDVDSAAARQLLDGLDEPEPFEPGPFPDLEIMLRHISGGPRVADAITGFVRVAPGITFPHHEHLGDEHVLVLQGHCVEAGSGAIAGPGEVLTRTSGSAHEISALPGATDLLYLAVVHTGVKIGGVVMGPDSPEL